MTAASAADVARAYDDNKLAQVLYHDWEARTYDDKWSISFDERCIDYARDRFVAITGAPEPWPYTTALELGAGTGFFSLNLKQAGVLDEVHVTDLSPGWSRRPRPTPRSWASTSRGGSPTLSAFPTTTTRSTSWSGMP